MSKKTFFIFFVVLGLFSAYFIFENDQSDSTAHNKTRYLGDSQDSHLVQQKRSGYSHKPLEQEPFTNSASNSINDIQRSVTSNDTIEANAIIETLDQLLTSNDLEEFSELLLIEAESICQKNQYSLSELACQVLQHRIELVKQQDDANYPLESDWISVEQNGGGIELEENGQITALSAAPQITRESGRQGDDLESSLQTLANRALFDLSADVRFKAIQEAVLMKSEALEPLLQDALNDENLANRELAAEGLRQLRETSMIVTEASNKQQTVPSNLAHISRADQSAR